MKSRFIVSLAFGLLLVSTAPAAQAMRKCVTGKAKRANAEALQPIRMRKAKSSATPAAKASHAAPAPASSN